jgi:hypothetical protein
MLGVIAIPAMIMFVGVFFLLKARDGFKWFQRSGCGGVRGNAS